MVGLSYSLSRSYRSSLASTQLLLWTVPLQLVAVLAERLRPAKLKVSTHRATNVICLFEILASSLWLITCMTLLDAYAKVQDETP
jgi:hypothetical protein